jgi:hypothetical protein
MWTGFLIEIYQQMAALQSTHGSSQTRGCLLYLLDEVFPEYVDISLI